MTDLHQESTWIHLLRGGILLAALVVVPGTAVCWNLISKDIFLPEVERICDLTEDDTDSEADESHPDADSAQATAQTDGLFEDAAKPVVSEAGRIRQMAGSDESGAERPISPSFDRESAIWAVQQAEAAPKVAQRHLIDTASAATRNFSDLESRLKQLGAKYYRLEKWGSRGDLFRFSCYVSSSQHYQKHFQAIDPDELRVMENVIRDIEAWRSGSAPHHENRP